MANNTTTNGHIESLIDYVLDVKPYHVKLAGGVEEYVFQENSLNVNISEDHRAMVVVGPDYVNASLNPERAVWQNASPRPISTTSTTRIVQSDGQRRVYSIPAIIVNKIGSDTGNVFKTVAATAATEIPGLNIGLFDTRAFSPNFGSIVDVKKNNVSLVKDTDYVVSRGAYSFDVAVGGTRTWKQHNLSSITAIAAETSTYGFDNVVRKFGTVKNITVSQTATVYEEFKLTYATETTVNVIGSISGDLGTATFDTPFVHSLISFTYTANTGEEVIPVMTENDEFILTPNKKICIHTTATPQTWTLVNVGSKYKVFGSVTGWTADAYVGTWYDNGQIAFKIPKLQAWAYVNGVSLDTAALTDKSVSINYEPPLLLDGGFSLDDSQDLDGILDHPDAMPSVYTFTFREGSPTIGEVHSASVFNNIRGYRKGLEIDTEWTDGWLNLEANGNWVAGDQIKVVLAPQGWQTWFGNYDETPYEWSLYDMGTAERAIPVDMLRPGFPLYHSKDAVIVFSVTPGDQISVEKAQRDYVRLRFGNGEALHDALGAENGWIPIEYRPNADVPNFATSIDAYLASDSTTKMFTITQPSVGGKPGLASIEFDTVFFNDFITSSTMMTFEFHQSDNYGPKVGVNLTESLQITVNTIPWNLFLDGTFNLDGSEELDGMQN